MQLSEESLHPVKHVNRPLGCSLWSTCACTLALTSDLLVAFITVTLAKHPEPTTVPSSGSRVLPQSSTSTAVELFTSLVKTHVKSLALVQSPFGVPDEVKVVAA